jgi:hypothetical protein
LTAGVGFRSIENDVELQTTTYIFSYLQLDLWTPLLHNFFEEFIKMYCRRELHVFQGRTARNAVFDGEGGGA